MKGIALIRVSTDSQDLKQQSEVVINEMIRDGYTNDNIILIEDKESGVLLSEEERQGLTKMKSYIESDNEINAVYVFELSRLSRKPEVLYSIRNYLVEHKIQLVVLKPSIKLFEDGRINETANMMFAIFAGMAEQEGYLRKERMSRGKRKTVREGKWTGGRLLLGYTVDSNNTLIIDEPNAIIVRNIFNRYAMGNISVRKLAIEMLQTGELFFDNYQDAASRVHAILTNVSYTGAPIGKLNIKYPPIIDKELFDKVAHLLEDRKTQPKTIRKHTSLLQGIIRDGLTKLCLVSNANTVMYQMFREFTNGNSFNSSINLNLTDSVAWHLTMNYQAKTNTLLNQQMRENSKKRIKLLYDKTETAKKKILDLKERELRIQKRIISGKLSEKMGDEMLENVYEEIYSTNLDIEAWGVERINLISYCQMTEMIDDESTIQNLSSITDLKEKKRLISESIKHFDIYQILERKRYYMGVVTFMNDTSVSFTMNTYSKEVRYLDGEKMRYEYRRTYPREVTKQTRYDRKTNGPNIRWNQPQPDVFYP